MARVRAGEIDLLEDLFERHHRQLYRYFLGRTHDPSGSEDCVQDVFHRVLRYRRRFRDSGSFTFWLYTIAKNVFSDHVKRQPKSVPIEQIRGRQEDDRSNRGTDHRVVMSSLLRQLSDADREIVLLSRVEQLSIAEMAELLGCSPGATKVRIHRALRRLREIYDDAGQGGTRELSNSH
ncbi:MAG: RNA polymerase sigma factor [Acidobacteria bacterium]|nr:RNA polymerase sigma factor [Acidobacteriota bacterium]